MMQQYLICLSLIVSATIGQRFYKDPSECPGNLKWKTTATTFMGHGPGLKPDQLTFPQGLFIEPKTQILYVADVSNNRVQKVYPDGRIEIAAGQLNGTGGSTADTLNGPRDVFADEHENVYIADWGNQRVQFWRKDAKYGQTVAGNGIDGTSLSEVSYPIGVSVDSKNNVIVAEYQNQRITQWAQPYSRQTSTGTVIGGGNNPSGFYYDELNNVLYIANEKTSVIIQWFIGDYEPRNVYAGIPNRPGNSSAQLNQPQGVTMDNYGNLYIVDCENHRIQLFCPDAVFGFTIAGTGSSGKSSSELSYPRGVALDADLNLYVTDTYNQRIQKFERIQ